MNPFTDTLIAQIDDTEVSAFVAYWDRLEALVIRVYKGKVAAAEDVKEWKAIHPWLQTHYPHWREVLHPFWQDAIIGVEPAKDDPFEFLLATSEAAEFVGNWLAMQTLPAARQVINAWLLAFINAQDGRN
jgi:hypothetical protein